MEQVIKISAPAKINLGLSVLKKRDDGYHEIQTLFQAVSLCDELELRAAEKGIELICEGGIAPSDIAPSDIASSGIASVDIAPWGSVPTDQANMVFKAAEVFFSRVGSAGGVRISLRKNIPVAAGLGGGSSDAAATLKGLSKLFNIFLPSEEWMEMGRQLGADVPFFLFGNSAMGEGTGADLSPSPPLTGAWIVIINPGFPVSTEWVYRNASLLLTKKSNHITMVKLFLKDNDLESIGRYLHNDLEAVVLGRYPIINELKNRLLAAGAVGAIMSGSGASVFGIFVERSVAEEAFNLIQKEGRGWKIFLSEPLTKIN